jgi:hypothetical protein
MASGGDGVRWTLAQTIGPLALRYTDSWQIWASVPGFGGTNVGWWIHRPGHARRRRFAVLLLVPVEAVEAVVLSVGAAGLVSRTSGPAASWIAGAEAARQMLR